MGDLEYDTKWLGFRPLYIANRGSAEGMTRSMPTAFLLGCLGKEVRQSDIGVSRRTRHTVQLRGTEASEASLLDRGCVYRLGSFAPTPGLAPPGGTWRSTQETEERPYGAQAHQKKQY